MKKIQVAALFIAAAMACQAQKGKAMAQPRLEVVLRSFNIVQRGDCQSLEKDLADGIDPNLRGPAGRSLLAEAVIWRRECAVRLLLTHGANTQNAENHGLVSAACRNDDFEIVKDLVEIGKAPLNRTPGSKEWDSPLVASVVADSYDTFYYFLEHGANPNDQDLFGTSALMMASAKGRMDMMAQLKKHGADFNQRDDYGRTALVYACEEGQPKVIQFLLDNGADPCIVDGYGKTPQEHAMAKGVDPGVASLCSCSKK